MKRLAAWCLVFMLLTVPAWAEETLLGRAIPDCAGPFGDGIEKLTEKPSALVAFLDGAAPEGEALTAALQDIALEMGESMTVILIVEGQTAPMPEEAPDGFQSIIWDEGGEILAAWGGGELPLLLMADERGRVVYVSQEPLTGEPVWTVFVLSPSGEPVPGVTVLFCTDTLCSPVRTDETGAARFAGEIAAYHVKLLKAPAGYRAPEAELILPPLPGEAALILEE